MHNYTVNSLNVTMGAAMKTDRGPDFSSLLKNRQRIEELDKQCSRLNKAISAGTAHLAKAERKSAEAARLLTKQTEKIKGALLTGKKPNPEDRIHFEGRITELHELDDDFPARPAELKAALVELQAELSSVEFERTECFRRARRLAQQYFTENFEDLEIRYQELVAMTRECLEHMLVQAAMAGTFFDYQDPEHRRRNGGDTRNPSMVKALKYIQYTAAMINGNWTEGLQIQPETVLIHADQDMQRIIDGLKDWRALPVNAIRSRATADETMKQRFAAAQANRQAQDL